jgi:hypothetical protein
MNYKPLLPLTCFCFIVYISNAQSKLKTSDVTGIPIWTQYGIARNYTREDILSFIYVTGWQAQYVTDKRMVPYAINKASDEFLDHHQTEARTWCYKMNLNNDVYQTTYIMVTRLYGYLPESDFRKYCLMLVMLSRIDISLKNAE